MKTVARYYATKTLGQWCILSLVTLVYVVFVTATFGVLASFFI